MKKLQYKDFLMETLTFWNIAKRVEATEFEIGFNMAVENCHKDVNENLNNISDGFSYIVGKIMEWQNIASSTLATNSCDAGFKEGMEYCLLDLQIILEEKGSK